MGYDVHICRTEDWFESEANPIPLAEWLAYVQADPEMRLGGVAVAAIEGQPALPYANAGLAVWIAYSRHDEHGNMAWFDHDGSRITVKNADEEILDKMRQVASALRARVIGDDGEAY